MAALKQLWAEIRGNLVIGVLAFVVTFVVFMSIHPAGVLRMAEEGELEGIDIPRTGPLCTTLRRRSWDWAVPGVTALIPT